MKKLTEVDATLIQDLKEKIALGCRILAKLELADYLGHVSARIPDTEYVLIKARGLDTGSLLNMTPERVVVVDLEGNRIQGDNNPPDEVVLHTEVFKARPDVMSVVHTHQAISTIFGDLGKKTLPMQGIMAAVCHKEMPVYESSLKIVNHEQGADVAKTLGSNDICHLRNHGILSVGDSIEKAVIYAIWLEHQAKLTMYASMMGTPRGMSQEELELQLKEPGPTGSRWNYYCSLLNT